MTVTYIVEIYEPGSEENVRAHFKSDKPFMTLRVGDSLTAVDKDMRGADDRLRITGVHHILWDSPHGNSGHKIMIYTERAADVDEDARRRNEAWLRHQLEDLEGGAA
jgi:hypothetical protein